MPKKSETCPKCKYAYDLRSFSACPRCFPMREDSSKWGISEAPTKAVKTIGVNERERANQSAEPISDSQANGIAALVDLATRTEENTRKTKHAVRAFVLFLVYQLSFTTMAVFLWNLSLPNSTDCIRYVACSGNLLLQILSVTLWLIGVVVSSKVGWAEIRKSD